MNKEKDVTISLEEFPAFKEKMMEIADRDNERSILAYNDIATNSVFRERHAKHNEIMLKLYATAIILDTIVIGLLVYIGFIK